MIDLVFDNFADEQFQLVYRSWLILEVPEGLKNYNVTNFKNQGKNLLAVQKREIVCNWYQGTYLIYLSWKIGNLLNLLGLGK